MDSRLRGNDMDSFLVYAKRCGIRVYFHKKSAPNQEHQPRPIRRKY
jgi:hypothetical protein